MSREDALRVRLSRVRHSKGHPRPFPWRHWHRMALQRRSFLRSARGRTLRMVAGGAQPDALLAPGTLGPGGRYRSVVDSPQRFLIPQKKITFVISPIINYDDSQT